MYEIVIDLESVRMKTYNLKNFRAGVESTSKEGASRPIAPEKKKVGQATFRTLPRLTINISSCFSQFWRITVLACNHLIYYKRAVYLILQKKDQRTIKHRWSRERTQTNLITEVISELNY